MQTVYLDQFYKQIKKYELKQAIHALLKVQEEEMAQIIAEQYDVSILIFDGKGKLLFSSNYNPARFLYEAEFSYWCKKAEENNGEYVEVRDWMPEDYMPKQKIHRKKPEETMTWVRVVSGEEGQSIVYILESIITPVNATVHTLRIQLIYSSIIMLALSLGMAWILSKGITRSIIRLNTAAKELAKANYNISFTAGDYKEITELSETLNYATKELRKTEQLQRELLANVSHDLRTPLTMITAYGEMIRDLPGEDTPENVQVIIDEAMRLTALVNDILDISKQQAGVINISLEEYNLTQSIQGIIDRFFRMLGPKGYQIQFLYKEEVFVYADKEKLGQVIYNLVGNAINYTGKDKKVIVKQSCLLGRIRVEVIDTGDGIPEEELPYIWERYYKGNQKRVITGTGLGLSIVKNILKLHKANFGVQSKKGEGSVFWFEIEN